MRERKPTNITNRAPVVTKAHDRAILTADRTELRGPSGRLYGVLDRRTLTIEVKRKGEEIEAIDLKPYLIIAEAGI